MITTLHPIERAHRKIHSIPSMEKKGFRPLSLACVVAADNHSLISEYVGHKLHDNP
jgi:hypothetical protein